MVAIFFALHYLPGNGPKSTMPRFDIASAVMNALTFGLLITALSGFAQGQSLLLTVAEVAAGQRDEGEHLGAERTNGGAY